VGSLGFFIDNPPGLTVALESTQPLNGIKFQVYLLRGKIGRCEWLTTLPTDYGSLNLMHPPKKRARPGL